MTKPKMPKLKYFFYRDELHRKIHINRGADLVTAFNYPQSKVFKYIYSDVRRNGERAFSTAQVAEMVDRTAENLTEHIREKRIQRPQFAYSPDRNYTAYYWREKDIMALHDFLKTVHIGRPRKDGEINTRALPSAAELRAMIRQGIVLYVKTASGDFVPTWKAEKF